MANCVLGEGLRDKTGPDSMRRFIGDQISEKGEFEIFLKGKGMCNLFVGFGGS